MMMSLLKSFRPYGRMLVWMIVLAFLLMGCGQKPRFDAVQEPPKAGSTDAAGRVVQPGKAERIACLWAMSGHTVVMLGRAERIVAVAQGLKRDIILNQLAPSIATADTPMVGGGIINIESLLKTNPDIIFIAQDVYQNENEVMKLERTGIPYVVIGYGSIAQQQKMIELIGEIVGAKEKAVKYNQYYQKCIELVRSRIGDMPAQARPRVYHAVNEPLKTVGAPSLSNDWLQITGAINVAAMEQEIIKAGNDSFVSLEQIIAWQPQIILVNENGVVDAITQNSQWQAIEAVRNGRVWQMPVGISRWGHPGSLETPLAILWTAKMLYPDKFADLDMRRELKAFYREFFSLDVPDEMADQILQGKGRISKKAK